MKQLLLLVLLAAPLCNAAAQFGPPCFWWAHPVFYHRSPNDSTARSRPFLPSRFGGHTGLSALTDRRATPFFGGELSGHYFLSSRLFTGLQVSTTVPTRLSPGPRYDGAEKPSLQLTTFSWRSGWVLTDNARLRTSVQAGVGLGRATLRDEARQVPVQSNCGCDNGAEALRVAVDTVPLAELGVASSYKIRKDVWLTAQGQYRWWLNERNPGLPGQFSHYVMSLGVSIPDFPPARRR